MDGEGKGVAAGRWRGNVPIFVFSRINYSEMSLQIPRRQTAERANEIDDGEVETTP